jgi:hypothetical protein
MVDRWADDPAEFVKRTAYALLASLALHDKKSGDEPFLTRLVLIEAAATDDRTPSRRASAGRFGRSAAGEPDPAGRGADTTSRFDRQELKMDRQGREEGVCQRNEALRNGSATLSPPG